MLAATFCVLCIVVAPNLISGIRQTFQLFGPPPMYSMPLPITGINILTPGGALNLKQACNLFFGPRAKECRLSIVLIGRCFGLLSDSPFPP